VVYFFLPETQKHSLEDMDDIFRTSKNVFEVVTVSRRMASEPMNRRQLAPTSGGGTTRSLKLGGWRMFRVYIRIVMRFVVVSSNRREFDSIKSALKHAKQFTENPL